MAQKKINVQMNEEVHIALKKIQAKHDLISISAAIKYVLNVAKAKK